MPRGLYSVQSGLRQRQQPHVAKHCAGEHSRLQLSLPLGDFVNPSQYWRRDDDINLHRLGRKLGKVDIYQSPNAAGAVIVSSMRLNGRLLCNELNIMDRSFDHLVFSKNKQRLLDADMAREFLLAIVEQAREQRLLSEERFSVDGALLEAWASVKSFRPRDEDPPSGDGSGEGGGRNREVDFRGERRRNETHRSTTDPDARLARKGKSKEARLCFGAHVLTDNREGLVVDVRHTPADGAWERDAALEMLASAPSARRITVGADRGYDTRGFIKGCRNLEVTPHVAPTAGRPVREAPRQPQRHRCDAADWAATAGCAVGISRCCPWPLFCDA